MTAYPNARTRRPSEEGETAQPHERIESLMGPETIQDLDVFGNAVLPNILSVEECRTLSALYQDSSVFRSRVVMQRHGFGRGESTYGIPIGTVNSSRVVTRQDRPAPRRCCFDTAPAASSC